MKTLLAAMLALSVVGTSTAYAQDQADDGAVDAQPATPIPTLQPPPPPPTIPAAPSIATSTPVTEPAPQAVQQPAPQIYLQQQQQPQPAAQGQWVYTAQYGWVWMPYGQAYTYVPSNETDPYMYVYYPSHGWRWLASPWVFGYGPRPYWGVWGPAHFAWYSRPWFHVTNYRSAWASRGYWGGNRWGGYTRTASYRYAPSSSYGGRTGGSWTGNRGGYSGGHGSYPASSAPRSLSGGYRGGTYSGGNHAGNAPRSTYSGTSRGSYTGAAHGSRPAGGGANHHR